MAGDRSGNRSKVGAGSHEVGVCLWSLAYWGWGKQQEESLVGWLQVCDVEVTKSLGRGLERGL
jgi:hypothetical protein